LDRLVSSYGLAIVCFLAGTRTAIGVQVLAFLALLFIDLRLKSGDVISATYLRVRTMATTIAVVSLLIVIAR
jgi:hypothetical protein